MPYRLEQAKSSRAGCQNKECKDKKVKIQKGELRLGTWLDNDRFQSWIWRHWGCVTPKIISNLNSTLDEAGSGEKDFTLLDGFDELPEDLQKKVREALEQGHINDDEWNGDIEMNRPGKTGFHARASKKGAANKDTETHEEEEEEEEEKPEAKPKGKRGRPSQVGTAKDAPAKKAKKSADSETAKNAKDEPEEPKEARKRGRPRKPVSAATPVKDPNAPKRGRGRPKKSVNADDAAAANGEGDTSLATNGGGEH